MSLNTRLVKRMSTNSRILTAMDDDIEDATCGETWIMLGVASMTVS